MGVFVLAPSLPLGTIMTLAMPVTVPVVVTMTAVAVLAGGARGVLQAPEGPDDHL